MSNNENRSTPPPPPPPSSLRPRPLHENATRSGDKPTGKSQSNK
ncbi:hypothetical protein P4645_03405 [Lysinibacillus fusiformis]|nr:hypothetical protein [Lysinibacillus fusiformis]MED4075284.1 hypothetical protein [Lysinibacillus fusiformis]